MKTLIFSYLLLVLWLWALRMRVYSLHNKVRQKAVFVCDTRSAGYGNNNSTHTETHTWSHSLHHIAWLAGWLSWLSVLFHKSVLLNESSVWLWWPPPDSPFDTRPLKLLPMQPFWIHCSHMEAICTDHTAVMLNWSSLLLCWCWSESSLQLHLNSSASFLEVLTCPEAEEEGKLISARMSVRHPSRWVWNWRSIILVLAAAWCICVTTEENTYLCVEKQHLCNQIYFHSFRQVPPSLSRD